MRTRLVQSILFLTMGLLLASTALAGPVTIVTDPSLATEIGSRIRWGNTGFEASIFDSDPFVQAPTLNPSGAPIWVLNAAYDFEIKFDGTTGTLTLSVDFNRNTSFGTGETISRSLFNAPGPTDYTGFGFTHISISGNEGGSTGRSQISNLAINGNPFANLAPGGGFLETFYSLGGPTSSIVITGNLTFLTSGTSQERPSWNFNFKNSTQSVPEPGSLVLLGLALAGLPLLRRRG